MKQKKRILKQPEKIVKKAGRHAIRTAPKSAAANDEKRRTMILHRFCYRDYCYCSGGWSITLNLQKEKGLKR